MRDQIIDEALRRAPEVHVPQHFSNRVLASLQRFPAEKPGSEWLFPALMIAGTATLGSLGWAAFSLGLDRWLTRPAVLAAILATEAAASLVWAWRTYRSAR